jgi:two-component system, OmpR family, sensor kinase
MSDRGSRLAIVAHELRSPVAALDALAQAARTTTDPDLLTRLVRLGVAAGRDIDRICTDAELSSLEREPVRIADLLGACGALGAVTEDVPLDWVVEGDATRLRQALANVVGNGLRHGTEVSVTARLEPASIVLDVVDNGSGVPPGLDVFERGVSGAGSSGYGLWLARAIVEAHGGTLDVVPAASGATLRFVLPRAFAS